MAVFRVEGKRYPGDVDQVLHVAADTAQDARAIAQSVGLSVTELREVRADEVPAGVELIHDPGPDPLKQPINRLVDSDLFQRPERTIALGVAGGIVLGFIGILLISLLLNLLFGLRMG